MQSKTITTNIWDGWYPSVSYFNQNSLTPFLLLTVIWTRKLPQWMSLTVRNTHVLKGKRKPHNKAKSQNTELDADHVTDLVRAFWWKWYLAQGKMKSLFLIKSAVTLVWKLAFSMGLTFLSYYLKYLLYKHRSFSNIKDIIYDQKNRSYKPILSSDA